MEQILNRDALIADVIRTLPRGKNYPRPVAVILLAPPGAGKFELAERLAEELGFVHIKVDQLKALLAPRADIFAPIDEVVDLALQVMVSLTSLGYSSVLDRNVNRKGYREKLKLDVENAGGGMVEIEIECPDEVALSGIEKDNLDITIGEREGHILDREFFEFKKNQVEPPIGENRYKISCQYAEEDWQRLLNFLHLKLTS